MKGIIDSDVLSFDAKSRRYPGNLVSVMSPDTKRVIMHHVNPRFVAHPGIASIRNKQMAWVGKLRDGRATKEHIVLYCAENLPDRFVPLTANARAMDPEDVGVILEADVGIAMRGRTSLRSPLFMKAFELLHGTACVLVSVPLIPMRIETRLWQQWARLPVRVKAADGEPNDHSCQSNAGSQECRQKNGSTRQ